MDILTHVFIGATASSPWWASHPLESVAFTLGSVLPDCDAISRQFGKVAFMRTHQGWTHAIPLLLTAGIAAAMLVELAGLGILLPSVAACVVGAVLHSVLDWTNTYGVRIWAPFDARRHAAEWIFFIDAGVLSLTLPVLVAQLLGSASVALTAGWGGALLGYVAIRAALRHRAGRAAPDSVALIPSALWPWRFHGLERGAGVATTFTLNALTGARGHERRHDVCDDQWADRLRALPEFRAMADLSAGYCVVSCDDELVECRDLRTRHSFGTHFGRLLVRVDGPTPIVVRFDV